MHTDKACGEGGQLLRLSNSRLPGVEACDRAADKDGVLPAHLHKSNHRFQQQCRQRPGEEDGDVQAGAGDTQTSEAQAPGVRPSMSI